MAVGKYIGDGNPDGCSLGGATTEKISFYGVTPVTQPTSASQAAVTTSVVTTAATTTTPWGFATSTQANDLATIVANTRTLANQVRSELVTLGLIKGS